MPHSSNPVIDRRNLDFVLYELLKVQTLTRYPQFSEHGRETFDGAIDLAQEIALKKFFPHNRTSDTNEPHIVDGRVKVIPEIKSAINAYIEGGFGRAHADQERGGMQLPLSITLACDSIFQGANPATSGYALLTNGVASLLSVYGSPEQKNKFLEPIWAGRFSGTMCLSEPQAGSSLADIRTQATLGPDGRYRISGAKMWISAGEHDLSENIIHLVLAKIPGGPPGTRGISLFIVPKYKIADDGSIGPSNDVVLAGVNHKMGQRGLINTFLKFGENRDCEGFLVGNPHQGLAQMFHMMNEARISVGMGSAMLGYAGYLYSLEYAKQRLQGRHPGQKDATLEQISIIEHADVRRMLLAQKAYVEGSYALLSYTSLLLDIRDHDPEIQAKKEAALLLDLLTPIAKAWSSNWNLKANELAIQVLGGYGFSREYPVEQFYRDNRINPIHEGTNGIQALDLLGRKVSMENGAALELLAREMGLTIREASKFENWRTLANELGVHLAEASQVTQTLVTTMGKGDIKLGLANATLYLEYLGAIVIAWTWLRQAVAAELALSNAVGADLDFYRGKLQAARYFFKYELPTATVHARLLKNLDRTTLEMEPNWF